MKNKLVKFLLDNNLNDQCFDNPSFSKTKFKFHKEQYDDRFTIIYLKNNNDRLRQEDYRLGGYLDIKEKNIYDCDFWLREMLPEEDEIKIAHFEDVSESFSKGVCDYIEKYSFKNEDKLKDIAIEKYNHIDDWKINRYISETRKQFIEEENPIIKLEQSYRSNEAIGSGNYNSYNIYHEYLNNPEKTIEKYSKKIIDYENNKEELGLDLLIYRDKIDLLNKILINKDNEFNDLYINKKIYFSIKDIDAKTLNITINYGGKELTFKYDYNVLKRDLLNDNRGSSDFGVAYDKVSEFIKENDKSLEKNRYREDFSFANISSITYGKKELYHHDFNISKNDVEQEQEDLEMEI